MIDSCRVFILECILQATYHLSIKNVPEMFKYFIMAAVTAFITLEASDNHFKQAIISIERSQSILKKRFKELSTKDAEKQFSDILSKLKKGNLTKDEKLVANMPQNLELELSIYESLSIE